ncbi:MAG: dienelactone hydrolase family protein [Planctomycetes bacterium]|nr:dienelactone hydrolase family protein [Planctomycetota bacterium]
MKIALACLLLLGGPLAAFGQEHVKSALDKSPRHHEWVEVQNGDRKVHCFVAFPEAKGATTAVLVIHENKGLTDWVRLVADQVAEAGYLAIAPDLLSGMAPGGGRTKDFPDQSAATEAIYKLKPEQVMADLKSVADHVLKIPACNGKLTSAGFCWGGGQSFRFATTRPDLKAAMVFYGSFGLTKEDAAKIICPVYGFYGGNDARIGATIPATVEMMKLAGKKYEPVTYEGAGHGFMRMGEEPNADAANRKGRDEAWKRWKEILQGI